MSFFIKIRKGEGPFWGRVKGLAKVVLGFHLPVGTLTRPFFSLLYHLHVASREGLLWTLRFFWYEPLFRSRCEAVGKGFRMEMLPYVQGAGRIIVGNHVSFAGKPEFGFSNRVHRWPQLAIGDDTFIGHACAIHVAQSVRIGKHCLLASDVRVSDFDGHPVDHWRRRAKEPTPPEGIRPVVIGNDVWLGQGSIILKGVTIGDRSIVGAGAVVTRDVPPDVVVAGNPARVVKNLVPTETRNGTLQPCPTGELS